MSPSSAVGSLVRYRPGLYALVGLLAGLMYYLFPLVPGLVVQRVFDALTGSGASGVTTLLLLLIATVLVRVMVLLAATAAEVTLTLTLDTLLRQNVFTQLLRRPAVSPLPGSAGEAVGRLRDDVRELSLFVGWTFDPLGQVVVLVVALLILARVNPLFTLSVFVPLLATVFAVQRATRHIKKNRRDAQQSVSTVTGFLGELFGAVQAVKVANAETHVVERLRALNEVRRRATLRDLLFTQLLTSLSANMANLGTGVLLLATARSMQNGTFSVGDFALFVSYLGWLTQVMSMSGDLLTRYRQMTVSSERLQELLGQAQPDALVAHAPIVGSAGLPVAPPDTPDRFETLEARGLTYHHPQSGRGVEDIDLTLRRGSFTVVTGTVGSGKTTLVRALLGLLPLERGTVTWNAVTVDDPAEFLGPPRTAYTPQTPHLFSATVKENVLLGATSTEAQLGAALHKAVLEPDVATLEHGLETFVGPHGVKLSGGQTQRTAAARMLVRRPDLMVVDDVSSALDTATEALLWQRIRNDPNTTCLAVSHRRAVLEQADHIILLQDGSVVAEGPATDLLGSSELFRQLWHGTLAGADDTGTQAPTTTVVARVEP